jgi:23S rRNA pseudouridine955/2504/2580 synthase
MIELVVGPHDGGQRLDRWFRKAFSGESLSTLFGIIRKKKVRVNGKVGKAPDQIEVGDVIQIYENLSAVTPTAPIPVANAFRTTWRKQEIDERLCVVTSNVDFVVLNKPSGLASQPGTNQKPGDSLVELLWAWGDQQGLDFKPALVHRLDQETSGLIVAALTGPAVRSLNALIRARGMRKEYLALVSGHMAEPSGTINIALERTDSALGAKMEAGQGKDCITHYQVEKTYGDYSLVRILLETGRMHQIRTHFATIGHPLLGDGRYGDFALNREVKKTLGLRRLFLHSALLEFPWKGKNVQLMCKLPPDLQSVVDALEVQ